MEHNKKSNNNVILHAVIALPVHDAVIILHHFIVRNIENCQMCQVCKTRFIYFVITAITSLPLQDELRHLTS